MIDINDFPGAVSHEMLLETHRMTVATDEHAYTFKVEVWKRPSDGHHFGAVFCNDKSWPGYPSVRGEGPEDVLRSALEFAKATKPPRELLYPFGRSGSNQR